MRLKHSKQFMKGFRPVVEAVEGQYLLGGRMVMTARCSTDSVMLSMS